jgi:UDP-2-acetamido-2-deoxy-ribo-hexuluronate aminotransferase
MQKAVMDVIESTAFIKGPAVKKLEDELTAYLGGDVDSITCANGTEALLIALMALGVKPGDEVIIPDFTFIATGEVISLLGAVPVFCDVEPITFNLDPDLIEELITDKTVGIIPVSIFGQCADFDSIKKIADKHSLWVMEDGAQSFGAEYKGRKSCSLTDIATTSFFPAKPLGCYGDGGAVFTKDKQLASRIRVIMNHGQTERYKHSVIGVNGRMDTLQAAVVSVKLRYFEKEIDLRNKAADLYTKLLKGIIETPEILPENLSVWAQYTVRHDNRESIRKVLSDNGIPTAVHYPIPLHSQQAFAYLNNPGESCPVTSRLSNRVFSLPMHPYLSEEEITFITDTIKKAVFNG